VKNLNVKSPEALGVFVGLAVTLFFAVVAGVGDDRVYPFAILIALGVGLVSTAIGVLLGRTLVRWILGWRENLRSR
jgi:hypothetical protein